MSTQLLRFLAHKKAREMFLVVPPFIQSRIDEEIALLEAAPMDKQNRQVGDFSRACEELTALLSKPINQGTYVADSGGNGNFLICYLLGLSEILPLSPFYYCHSCGYYELAPKEILTGHSLPIKQCPHCQTKMKEQGTDIPLSRESLDKTASLGISVSKTFLAKNHLDMAETFNRPVPATTNQTFTLKICAAYLQIGDSIDVSLIESMVQDHHCNVKDIDYNDPKVFDTLFNTLFYFPTFLGQTLFKRVVALFKPFTLTFDNLVRLVGFNIGPASSILHFENKVKIDGLLDLGEYPTNWEDEMELLQSLGVNQKGASKKNQIGIDVQSLIQALPEKKEYILRLADFLKFTIYLPGKSFVANKTLILYRLAFLETYYPTEFKEALSNLGIQQK